MLHTCTLKTPVKLSNCGYQYVDDQILNYGRNNLPPPCTVYYTQVVIIHK